MAKSCCPMGDVRVVDLCEKHAGVVQRGTLKPHTPVVVPEHDGWGLEGMSEAELKAIERMVRREKERRSNG